jgi:hypothetical protein
MRACRGFVLMLALATWAGTVVAGDDYRDHMLVKVKPQTPQQLKALLRFDQLDIVPGERRDEPYLLAHPEDLQLLQREGISYEILQPNLEEFYSRRLGGPLDLVAGFHSYTEIMSHLDSLHLLYPAITTAKFSIGASLEGRQLWAIKISDNPDVDEDEPELFYNALTHAREPAGMELLLYFMDYLAQHYGTDAQVTYLVNNREFFFVPCMNPDGYVYNETNPNQPGGVRMWRKNRRNNGDGSYGIDLNRNYGVTWGVDDQGSSPTPSSETYRGTGPFSEPETQVVRDFMNSRHFIVSADYHTYSNLVLIPWGTSYFDGAGITDDDATYRMVADSMAYYIQQVNGVIYATGTAWELLYNTNGGSFDWEYGDRTLHSKIFGVSTEVGGNSDGFWPDPSRILPLSLENLPANLFLARMAESLMPPAYHVQQNGQCESELVGNGNGVVEPGETLGLTVNLWNIGRQSLSSLQGQLASADPYVTVTQTSAGWPTLGENQRGSNSGSFEVALSSGSPSPRMIPFTLHLTAAGGLDTTLPLTLACGAASLADYVESGAGNWTTGGTGNQWHISTRRASSPTHSWLCGTDGGNYGNNLNCWLLSDTFITGPGTVLSYDQWHSLEDTWDFGIVEIDTGTGWVMPWNPTTGNTGGWVHVERDLGLTCPETRVQVRFRMATDDNTNFEGWYVDNIQISPPPEFTLTGGSVSPAVGTADSVFTFSIVYTSVANITPSVARVYIDDSPHDLTSSDPVYTDGSMFTFSTTLITGRHRFYFFFTGSVMSVRDPASGTYGGPFVGQPVACYDFETDQGWTAGAAGDDATTGIWGRMDPEPTFEGALPVQPGDDHTPAPGVICYVTDGRAGSGVGSYDVDGGRTTLLSPLWDLSGYNTAALRMWTWYTNRRGNNPGLDTFRIDISSDGGTTWASLLSTIESWESWESSLFFLEDAVTLTNQMRLRVIASDAPPGSIVEAAVDDVCLQAVNVTPEVPVGLTIALSGNDLVLRWVASAHATGYLIERASSFAGPYDAHGTSPTTTFTDTGAALEAGPLYYQVKATN